jgi:chemotaxis-related protein WspB
MTMLIVPFQLGGEQYALPASAIIAVTQVPHLRALPHAPDWVKGLFRYQGAVLPAIDLGTLITGIPCRNWLSTRLLLVGAEQDDNNRKPAIGLVAERVTGTLSVEADAFSETGVQFSAAPWLGSVAALDHALLQLIRWEPLLTDELAQQCAEMSL